MKSHHILYVGDNEADLVSFSHQFQDFYTVHSTASVDEACRLVDQHNIDVILADLYNPGTAGAQIFGRTNNDLPESVHYIVTDYSDADEIINAANKGRVCHFFQKPWDERRMKLVIDNALDVAAAEKERAALEKNLQGMEASLTDSETRFLSVLDAMPDAFIVIDENGQIVSCNSQSEWLSGYTRGEILGQPIVKLILGRFHDHKESRQIFTTDLRFGQWGSGNDLYLLCKDGKKVPIEITLSPVNTGSGLLIAAAIKDLTERNRSIEMLRDSEETLRVILEALPTGVLIADSEGKTYYANRKAMDLTGRNIDYGSQGQEVGQLFELFVAGTDTKYPIDDLPINKALIGEISQIDNVEVAQPDGGRRSLEVWGSPVYDADGAIKFAIATAHDVTGRKVIEAQLRQAQKMEAIGQLTGGISHDFNNLLSVIMTSVQLLGSIPADGDERDGLMRQIENAVERGESLTRRLLAFSRRQTLQPRIIDVNDLVKSNSDALRRMLTEAVEIQTETGEDVWMTKVDPAQLEDALLNLTINARDAMPGGGTLTIRTTNCTHHKDTHPGVPATWSGDFVVLSVEDTGIGMSSEVLDHVFEPFFTTKGVGEGSGLGLSMVYGFAKQTGGHVTIESTEGEGTTVSLCLPREDGSVTVEVTEEDELVAPGGGGEIILVVEDNKELQDLVAVMLESLGYGVLLAKDGREALTTLDEAAQIDLVLSDVVLPGGMNGIDLLEKAKDSQPNLRCLYMSGYTALPENSLPEDVDLLNKPFRMNELARLVRKALGRNMK